MTMGVTSRARGSAPERKGAGGYLAGLTGTWVDCDRRKPNPPRNPLMTMMWPLMTEDKRLALSRHWADLTGFVAAAAHDELPVHALEHGL